MEYVRGMKAICGALKFHHLVLLSLFICQYIFSPVLAASCKNPWFYFNYCRVMSRERHHKPRRPLWHHKGLMLSFWTFDRTCQRPWKSAKEIRAASQFCSHVYYFSVFGVLLTVHIKCCSNRREKKLTCCMRLLLYSYKLLRNMYRRNTRHVWNMKQKKRLPIKCHFSFQLL